VSGETSDRPDWKPNFDWLLPDLAVGGCFPTERIRDLATSHAVKAIVDLRTEDRDDEAVLRHHGLTFLHLPTHDLCAVAQDSLQTGVDFANRHLDAGERVLIHCQHGIGRSATLALCVLVSRGHSPLDALELAKSRRPLVSPSPAQYEAWAYWLAGWQRQSGAPWSIPAFDEFKAIAYRHLQETI
jgi:protein-tyrosine phosphatase